MKLYGLVALVAGASRGIVERWRKGACPLHCPTRLAKMLLRLGFIMVINVAAK